MKLSFHYFLEQRKGIVERQSNYTTAGLLRRFRSRLNSASDGAEVSEGTTKFHGTAGVSLCLLDFLYYFALLQ